MGELEHVSAIFERLPVVQNLKQWVLQNVEIVCDSREKENWHIRQCH